jgi:hypothetical protein
MGALWLRPISRWLGPYGPALAVSLLVGIVCARTILAHAGEPGAPLDDSFIHLQYARRLAEGHFFSYVPGKGYTTGATSFLWPILLAPFHALGLRDTSLLYAAWLFGWIAHAGVAVEVFRLADRLAGRAAAVGAGAMSLLCGAFAWFAWSGMETIPFAWALLRAARASAAYCEPLRGSPAPQVRELVALGFIGPLLRPEGALCSLLAAAAIALGPRGERPSLAGRVRAWLPLGGPLVVPLLHLALSGHATSSTTMVKWLLANPTYDSAQVWTTVAGNVRLFFTNILDGGEWTALFLPEHFAKPLLLGAIALPFASARRRVPIHAVAVAVVALGALVSCTYLSFLWNRVRYVWPFAGAWFVLLACFAREAGDLVRRARPRLIFVTPLLAGALAGALAVRLPWAIQDLGQSARAIARQQVVLARWARDHLPADARIGVNDTGAIAYLGGRRTFDVVGLTTEGEARYWVAGAGSRFEHYESSPASLLPTHFIVYPHWMACPPLLGKELTSATVVDQSILGGQTMVAYAARYDALGSGALPVPRPVGLTLVDELDVSDLASEQAHAYDARGAEEQDNQVAVVHVDHGGEGVPPGATIADGGRYNRTIDRFEARLPAGRPLQMIMRVGAEEATDLVIDEGGREFARVAIAPGTWVERVVDLPVQGAVRGSTMITVRAASDHGGDAEGAVRFQSFHYWLYAR